MNRKIHKRYTPEIDFSGFDHIVIGSGMGGLTAATWLAKGGDKVAILERHYVPGGYTHSFKRKQGFQWDVGVHYVGNMSDDEELKRLFDFLSDGTLEWKSMGEVYDVLNIGKDRYEFKAGIENQKEQLKGYFPEESLAIDNYFKLLNKVNKRGGAFFMEKMAPPIISKSIGWIFRKRYFKYANLSTKEVLNGLTNNQRLIAVLCAQFGNYGLPPKYSSFGVHAMVIGHFLKGGYYPNGGAEQICYKTMEVLEKHGCTVYTHADVEEIVTDEKRVKGLRIGERFIPCDSVISNVGVNNTFNKLLSEVDRKRCGFDLQGISPSSAHLCLYIGLDKSDEELNLPKYNVWNFNDDDYDRFFDEANLESTQDKFAYISFPSAKDEEWRERNPGKATIQALTIGRYDWFSQYEDQPWMKREEAYQKLKKNFEDAMLDKLYKLFPQIKGHVVVTEVSTPLSTRHFSNYQNGEIYGLEHSPKRYSLPFLRPETKIKGLRLVGQDITTVGVAGAMMSGMICAITILKFRVFKLFRDMGKSGDIE